jgi:CelD/BcsL family acetyltransferase involved in cellulose biosynthesis
VKTSRGHSVAVVRDRTGLESLEDIWRASAIATGNLFVTPDWFFAYLEHAAGRPAVVVACDAGGDPLAILPLVEERRVLRFPGADYGDRFEPVVLAPDVRLGAVWRTLLGALRELSRDRLVVLDRIDRTLASAAYGIRHVEDVEEVLPFIRLEGMTWEGWFAARTANFRSEVRRKRRGIQQLGLDFHTVDDPDSAVEGLARHFELHDRRWAALERSSTLRSQRARGFHAGLARRLAERGWLRLWFLRSSDQIAASWYGWNLGGRYSYYQAGFDPQWGRFSPGTLLLVRTVEAALAEGASEYDLLLGDEQYKARFATETRRAQTIALPALALPQTARVYGMFTVRRLHRALPDKLQDATRRLVRSTHTLTRLISLQ